MTVPMMPGWWDQIAPGVQSLAQTALRATNPNFDNQVAALEFMRQNPANQQAMIDAASLNPQMIQQMLGQRMLESITGMGGPSFAAQVEGASRGLAQKPAGDIPDTFVNRAASAAARVPVQEELAENRQRVRYFTMNNARTELENKKLFPQLEAQIAEYDRLRTAIPNPGNINIEALAERYVNRKPGDNSVYDEYAAKIRADENAERLFWGSVSILQGMKDAEAEEQRRIAAEGRARTVRGQDQVDWFERQAATLRMQQFPELDQTEVVKWLKGEQADPLVTERLQGNIEANQLARRNQEYNKLVERMVGLARIPADRQNTDVGRNAKNLVNEGLRNLFGIPIEVASVRGGATEFWKKENKFLLPTGEEVDGLLIRQMLEKPKLANLVILTDEEFELRLNQLQQMKNSITAAEFEEMSALFMLEKARRGNRAVPVGNSPPVNIEGRRGRQDR